MNTSTVPARDDRSASSFSFAACSASTSRLTLIPVISSNSGTSGLSASTNWCETRRALTEPPSCCFQSNSCETAAVEALNNAAPAKADIQLPDFNGLRWSNLILVSSPFFCRVRIAGLPMQRLVYTGHDLVEFRHLMAETDELPVDYVPRVLNVGILLLADYQLSTVATFADTLQCATEQLGKGSCESILMSPAGRPAISICGRSLITESAQLWPENFSYLAIIGDCSDRLGMPEQTIQRYVQSADRLDVPLVGMGNGVATLARFGLLDGREACSAAATLPKWTRQFPGVIFRSGQLVVEDGNRITSLGGVVGGDLAALLLDRHFGRRLARRAVAGILLDNTRHPTAPPPSQFAFSCPADGRVAQAIDIMNANIPDPVPLTAIAGTVGLSTRQLDRLFIAAIGSSGRRAYLAIRIDRALQLLSQTMLSVTEIAHATGFVDGAHLAKTLKGSEGLTPSEIRSGVATGRHLGPGQSVGTSMASTLQALA